MPRRLHLLLPVLGLGTLTAQEIPAALLERLRDLPPHPRLFLSDAAFRGLRQRSETDATLQRYVDEALEQARACLKADDLRYAKRGPRLLHVSRDCLRRIQALALAWRWTGDEAFAERAVQDLRAVCAFADWNPSHFLDVAEMTHAVALGYDWLQSFLTDEDRAGIREALVDRGLKPGAQCYSGRGAWWTRSAFNWNQVCNAGLIVGALALADEEPELCRSILAHAVRSLPTALASYDPDGAWMEGPAYWDYATRYTAYGLDALRSALGTDLGLGERGGLRAAGWFPVYTAGPTGLFFNYADAGERARRSPSPCMFWLAGRYSDPALAAAEHAALEDSKAQPWHVVWYEEGRSTSSTLERARLFGGDVPVAVFRSAAGDSDALFAAIKGGYNQVNHGHLDLGSFVFDALGVRWATDLGADDYNLPGYWQMARGGKRWDYYRLSSRSHNVLLVDDDGQDPLAKAKVLTFSAEPPHIVLDLGAAYPKASVARRGLAMPGWRSLLVQDELELREACAVTWGLTTRAEAALDDDGSLLLRQGDEELLVRVLAPAEARWSIGSAEQDPPQRRNRGVRRVELRARAEPGALRIAVQLCPVWQQGPADRVALRPLGDW